MTGRLRATSVFRKARAALLAAAPACALLLLGSCSGKQETALPDDTSETPEQNGLVATSGKFTIYLQNHPNGRHKTYLTADSGVYTRDNQAEATNVKIVMQSPEGRLENLLETDLVQIDTQAMTGHCPNRATFERHSTEDRERNPAAGDGVLLEGSDVEWLGENSQLVIHTNASITVFREGTPTITSDRLEFNYRDFVVLFEGHVKATDPKATLTADTMLVYFENTNDLSRIEAVGNVVAVQHDPKAAPGAAATARGDKAVYDHHAKTLVLTGRPGKDPVVVRGNDSISSETITVHVDEKTVHAEKRVTLTGTRDKQPKPTVVTARALDYEYGEDVSTLDLSGGVHVADPQFTLDSATAIVWLQRKQGILRIDAAGNVRMDSQDFRATCGQVAYVRAKGFIELSKGKGVPGGTPVVTWGANSLAATSIVVWPDNGDLKADGSVVIKGAAPDRNGARQETTARGDHLVMNFPPPAKLKGKAAGTAEYTALLTDKVALSTPELKVTTDKALVCYEFESRESAKRAGATNLVSTIEAVCFSAKDIRESPGRSAHRINFDFTDKEGRKHGECEHFFYHRDDKGPVSITTVEGRKSVDLPARNMLLHGSPFVQRSADEKIAAPLIVVDLPNAKVRTPWGIHANGTPPAK